MNIAQWLKQVAQVDPKRPALFAGMRQIADYSQFDQRVPHRLLLGCGRLVYSPVIKSHYISKTNLTT